MGTRKEDDIIEPKAVFVGDPAAPVTLTEFADYESPNAVSAHEVVKEILQQYQGKVRFNFRHFPLRAKHQKAQKAAEAVVAAAQEGKFWEMHEILLANRRNLGTISLKSYAKAIGVTNKSFLDQLINGRYAWSVQDDLDEGLRLGVREIPTFFINGQKLEGPATVENIREKIEIELKKLST
ncbi:MAG: disulfide bond formation protein DsbA [Chitinophagaceae bacterium]|nr:MAG: disulfide bond formation protein DsbA [Chitinophagaceae bacterium]